MKLTTLNIFNRPGFSAIIFWAVFGAVMQAEACEPASGNEYERVFCQLKRSGRGEELPSIHDFRKNPPLMQALLLKKPAERAGIPLRIPERGNAETVDRQADLLLAPMVEPTLEPPKDQKLLPAKTVPAPQVVHKTLPMAKAMTSRPVQEAFASCVLEDFELRCEEGRYRLLANQANQHLPADALSDRNRLDIPLNSGQDRDAYLQQAYGRYLDGMIRIGLGASTMSYTKFVNLYDHLASQKMDFPARFETMYHFLKKDKSAIGVTTRLVIARGFTTRYCSDVRPDLLACEHGRENYLFIKIEST